MDFKEIQELIKLLNRYKLDEILIEKKDFKLDIKSGSGRGDGPKAEMAGAPATQPIFPVAAPVPVPSAPEAAPQPAEKPAPSRKEEKEEKEEEKTELVTIKAPMIGTFYRKPSPDKELFVKVGDMVQPGSVLCIIEAMKLFNEIESEVSGKIVKILVEDNSPVEYDQPLFLVEPN